MSMPLIPPSAEDQPADLPAAPPALPYATARADRPGRGFAIALAAHLALIGAVLLVLHERALRPPPPPTTVTLVIEKPPPAPPAPKPPAPKPPAPPVKAAAATLPMPPPPPPQPDRPPKPAAPRLARARPTPPTQIKTVAQAPGNPAQTHAPTATSPPRPAGGNPPPVYPYIAREQGDEGWVNLSVHVAADGDPDGAIIIESSGHLLLDDEARQNVLQHWHFQPALQNGQPVASTIDLWFHFALNDAGP
jgi:protein TonB